MIKIAVIPSIDDWESGEFPSAEKMNAQIRDPFNFLIHDRPIASTCRKLSTQNITSGGTVSFDTVLLDNDNMIDLTASASRITIQTAGFYLLNISFPYTEDAVGTYRAFRFLKNGTETSALVMPKIGSAGSGIVTTATVFKYLVANDYLQLGVGHDMTNFVTRSDNDGPTLSAMWLCS